MSAEAWPEEQIGYTDGSVTLLRFSPERSEKRQLIRFRVVDFHATSSVVDVVLRDLNSDGMSIETRHSLRVGASYPFRIRRRRQSVAIDGVVKWCRLLQMIDIGGGESQAVYRAGIAFSRRLDDFLPGGSAGSQIPYDPDVITAVEETRRGFRGQSSVSCPDCKVPAVEGARRCRICGSILRQV